MGIHLNINFYILLLFLFLNSHIPKEPYHIIVLGSSTAHGAGASSKSSSWVGLLKNHVRGLDGRFKVTNLAHPRITSYHILSDSTINPENRPKVNSGMNITKALSMKPSLIIVNLPSNDMIYNYSIMEQYENFLSILCESDVPVYFTTAQPRNSTWENREKLKQLSELIMERLPAIDFWTGLASWNNRLMEEYNSGDDLHLNDVGHRFVFERVIEVIPLQESTSEMRASFPKVSLQIFTCPR